MNGTAAPSVADVNAAIETLWPLDGASSWDAPGLVVGDPRAPVKSIHLAVDAVSATVDEALSASSDLLLVHHPLLLRGVTSVAENTYKGSLISKLIRGGCALIASHTNADVVVDGVSDRLASLLGLQSVSPIEPGRTPDVGIGRSGVLPSPTTLRELATLLEHILPSTVSGIRVAGDPERVVERVALCGGAGDSLLSSPVVRNADVYITSDLRHHPASEAAEAAALGLGPALIDIAHWASESLWLQTAAVQLRATLPSVSITVSTINTDPWTFSTGAAGAQNVHFKEETP